MAKGARKKTKWVSLSLSNDTSTVPPAEHDAGSKSSQGPHTVFVDDHQSSREIKSKCLENGNSKDTSDRRGSWNDTNGQLYSNSYHRHPSRNYSSHFKNYNRNNYSHYTSSRKPHYNSHIGNGTSRNIANDGNASEAKNEHNSAVIINEDEYTKITTPRQDVLFKKGYLSRPKKNATTSMNGNENGTTTGNNSVNGTMDGSEVATASGSVSTAESVTSDSAYMGDGLLLDYSAPYPYFGYIDQSGVLVMNGFAVDNSGFPYMNGGQTYIYPTNYHCQSSLNGDVECEKNIAGSEPTASTDVNNQSIDTFNEMGLEESLPVSFPENAAEYLLDDPHSLNSISEENGQQTINDEEDCADLNQQVPQQLMLPPIANSYEYAQFYNTLYYPGCMLAPFPIMGNEIYGDQFDNVNEEEHASQLSFRKRKKRYRHWDEYPNDFMPYGTIDTMYQYPNAIGIPENGEPDSVNVLNSDTALKPSSCDQTVPIQLEMTAEQNNDPNSIKELPSSQQSNVINVSTSSSKSLEASKTADRSQHQDLVPKPTGRQRSHPHKNRKKDLIESTRAFAEQNIDLTRPASLLRATESQQCESSIWRTVRNGKEVKIQEDRSIHSVNSQNTADTNTKKDAIESLTNVKLFYDDCKEEPSMNNYHLSTNVSSKPSIGRKGKKTAKGKGKKSQKKGLSGLQQGFELIEPEFPMSEISNKIQDTTDDEVQNTSNENETVEEVVEGACEDNKIKLEIECSSIAYEEVSEIHPNNSHDNEDSEEADLEQDLRDIQVSDIHIDTTECFEDQRQELINVEKLCDLLVQTKGHSNEKDIDSCESGELHEVPSEIMKETDLTHLMYKTVCTEHGERKEDQLIELCNTSFDVITDSSQDKTVDYHYDGEDDQQKCKHFTNDEYFDNFDSGVQSPAAFTSSSCDSKERKSSTSSFGSQELQLTDAVTKWLSETLSNKRLEELFLLPEDPILLHRIHQFNVLHFDDSLVLTSDTYSSSSCDEADDSVDSDYMSDVQGKNRKAYGLDVQQKTELKKDQIAKQTANGHRQANGGCHSNHKQKRCIIM